MKYKFLCCVLLFSSFLTACAKEEPQFKPDSFFAQTNQVLNNITGLTAYNITQKHFSNNIDIAFSNRDFDTSYNTFSSVDITSNTSTNDSVIFTENTITITKSGSYVLTGSSVDTQIIVNCNKDEKVQLIFDNIDIKNSQKSAIHIAQADKVFITLKDGSTNTIESSIKTNGGEDAVIFSREDLTINGTGTLDIIGVNANGITSKDDLNITSGTFNISADKFGLEANDYIKIADGIFNINAKFDAIRTKTNDTKSSGNIYIQNGNFTINSLADAIDSKGDIIIESGNFVINSDKDGIIATNNLTIFGGFFDITVRKDAIGSYAKTEIFDGDFYIRDCFEGVESQIVEIHGGNFLIKSQDDGINCSYIDPRNKSGECYINITGGNIIIDSKFEADGIDSNNDLFISGGNIIISSNIEEPYNAIIDYEGQGSITGGTVIATGNLTVYNNQNFDENSKQCSIMVKLDSIEDGKITLFDKNNNIVLEFTPEKPYHVVLLSSPNLKLHESYVLKTPNSTFDIYFDDYIFGKYDDPHAMDDHSAFLKTADGNFMCEVLEVSEETAYIKITDYLSGENFGDFMYINTNNFDININDYIRIYYTKNDIHGIKELSILHLDYND